jgi:hypothetical protein
MAEINDLVFNHALALAKSAIKPDGNFDEAKKEKIKEQADFIGEVYASMAKQS